MPVTAHINLQLDFDQVVELVRQLPKKQQHQLANMIAKEDVPVKKLTAKEQVFLVELEGAVDFVNHYKKEKSATTSFKQMLDGL